MPPFALTLENLKDLCQRHGLTFKLNEELGQIAVLHQILGEDAPLYIIPYRGRGMVSFILPLPLRVPPARLPFIGEATTRLNSASYLGTWVLNIETGELYLRATLPAMGAEYSDEGVLFVIRVVVSSVEAAAAGLSQIVLAGKTSHDIWPRAAVIPGS